MTSPPIPLGAINMEAENPATLAAFRPVEDFTWSRSPNEMDHFIASLEPRS